MRQIITLIHHPTAALKISGFRDSRFGDFAESGMYLGNVYRHIMPPSLPRVAAVIERHLDADVKILDLRSAPDAPEETMKTVDWEGYDVEVRRIGAPPSAADEAIEESDWIGLTSHFTFEARMVQELIQRAKQVKPSVKVLVGGADVKARPQDYLDFGADSVCVGDFDPVALAAHDRPSVMGPHRHPFEDLIRPAFDKLPPLDRYTDSHDGPVPEGVEPPIGFMYFTRGCPRECDFCESRRTQFEVMSLEHALAMIDHYDRSGVKTLNFADDNLLLAAATKPGREMVMEVFRTLRRRGFAWEFPNGLEIGRFLKDGVLDEELMDVLLTHRVEPNGRIVGAYRVYVPLETFDHRDRYKKLRPMEDQNDVIRWLVGSGLPEVDFGVVVPPDADADTFLHISDGYADLKELVHASGHVRARYAVFHLIPIALHRSMKTKYTVTDFPEGWNFYFPIYDGPHLRARELFERRLDVVREIDRANFESMKLGQYSYA